MIQTNTEFFLNALLAASNKPDTGDEPRTEKDILETFWPTPISTLTRIEELVLDVLVNTGYDCAILDVKWGNDDETANEPPEPSSSIQVSLEVTGWTIEKYENIVMVWPRGPCSGGAGPTWIWFRESAPPPISFTLQ